MKVTRYGPGGYDPTKPNSNVVEEYDDGQPEYVDPNDRIRQAREKAAAASSVVALRQAMIDFCDVLLER